MTPVNQPLSYAPVAPWWTTARWHRRGLTLLLLMALVASAVILYKYELPRYRQRQAQRAKLMLLQKAGAHRVPADMVMYEEDPQRKRELLKSPDYLQLPQEGNPVAKSYLPEQIALFKSAFNTSVTPKQFRAPLFLHERTLPIGANDRRVFSLSLETLRGGYYQGYNIAQFRWLAYSMAWRDSRTGDIGVCTDSVELLIPSDLSGSPFCFYAGQPDPADPGHFTIDYAVGDRRGTIDGYIGQSPMVRLAVRNGPATRPTTLPARTSEPGTRWWIQGPS